MNIYGKLQKARVMLHELELKKTGENNGKLFFELGDFMPSAIVIFEKVGLCGVCSFTSELATLAIHDTENDCSPIIITSPFGSAELRGCHPVQNIGAVETYQRRYVWMAALDILEHEGIDSTAFDEFDVQPFIVAMESAKTNDDLNKAWESLKTAAGNKLDQNTLKSLAVKRNALAKALPMDDDRFIAALSALDSGKTTKETVMGYNLTKEQKQVLDSRPD